MLDPKKQGFAGILLARAKAAHPGVYDQFTHCGFEQEVSSGHLIPCALCLNLTVLPHYVIRAWSVGTYGTSPSVFLRFCKDKDACEYRMAVAGG